MAQQRTQRGYENGTAAADPSASAVAAAVGLASQACASCRKQKRKCDKKLPGCSLCARMGRPCDYTDASPSPTPEDFHYLRKKVQDLEDKLQSQPANTSLVARSSASSDDSGLASIIGSDSTRSFTTHFPPLFFLDSKAFEYGRFTIPKAHVPVPFEILESLGDMSEIQNTVANYFQTVHQWMPIVSKKRLYQQLMNPLVDPSADQALLYLCMKLIMQSPPEPPALVQTPLYLLAKRFYFLVETSGVYSSALLQANILIALFEIGHAIYPAAYLTIGQCARLGHAMGIHKESAPQMLHRVLTWAELEERRRIWWAVVILDRYVNLGSSGRPLATEEASRNTYLPSDDILWDNGEMVPSEPIFISSSTDLKVGPFARLAQAAHLLGRVIRHSNDPPADIDFRVEEATQLDRTLRALYALLPGERPEENISICNALAICYSAIMALYDPYTCQSSPATSTEIRYASEALAGLKAISEEVVCLAATKHSIVASSLPSCSPLALDCLYQAAANYAWLVRETGHAEFVEASQVVKGLLGVYDRRWRAAGEYVKILEATEFEMMLHC